MSIPATDPHYRQNALTLEAKRIRFYESEEFAQRYRILERLGSGGMGDVWHAFDLKLRVDVALKSLRHTTPETVEALRREVRSARQVISPNVCRIFDLIVEEGQEFLSMEYIDGITLLALLYEKSPLTLVEARQIASQFLSGLQAIHQAGLVHCDLKPENIMISRTGRVVVMDFGIAKPAKEISEAFSGTPPYMAPEQLQSGKIDARTDVYAAGAILVEMVTPIRDHPSREAVWNLIHRDPSELPEGPWKQIMAQALARNPEDRFASAGELAHALDEVTQRIDRIEERKPYPGLAAFSEADSQFFFGRELEVETIVRRLHQLHLLAIIGPSGAGKTSFLRAGLIPALPVNWSFVMMQPGDSPLTNLGQSLASEFSDDPEAVRKIVHLDDGEVALSLLQSWRQKHAEALLIVDRFEELFTLSDKETQTRFAELLGQAVLQADVRVLLTMRDDFLILCNEQPALVPIFSELTPLQALSGSALRRALVQPALLCGYRFEDEALIDEILAGVEQERGVLPLMAFAAARLWEKRDHQKQFLTREAYQQIGGVSGALAQHAEATMERIGSSRHSIVREIFRNLITGQQTRMARDTEELLSVFPDRKSAEEVLGQLIDARLLTSFEAPGQDGKTKRNIEIIHESLLAVWPRLVRWQTQDADSLQFHDQVRQAAHIWQERNRPEELLWTGTSYKEFEVWRNKYSGGLTNTEKAFADAMKQNSQKQRRRRRIFLSTTIVILLTILCVIASFWKSEKTAHQESVSQAQRAEASKLLALGRAQMNEDPTTALAYAIASLQQVDTQVGRNFALEALWKGPVAFIMPGVANSITFLSYSPNGKWLAAGDYLGVYLLRQAGNQLIALEEGSPVIHTSRAPQFSADSNYVVWSYAFDPSIVRVWSISQGKEARRFKMEGPTVCMVRGPKLIMISDVTGKILSTADRTKLRIRTWSFDESEPRIVGQCNLNGTAGLDISSDAQTMAYGKGKNVYIRSIGGLENAPETLVGTNERNVVKVGFHPNGKLIASADSNGEIRIWSITNGSGSLVRTITSRGPVYNRPWFDLADPFFSPLGSTFATSNADKRFCLWDMNGPADAEPLPLRRAALSELPFIAFDPSNRWALANYGSSLAFWPLNHVYPYVLHGTGDFGGYVSFTPDAKKLVSAFAHGDVRSWDMKDLPAPGRALWKTDLETYQTDVDPTGKYVALATNNKGPFLVSVANGTVRTMPGGTGAGAVSFSPSGRMLAMEYFGNVALWDLESNQVKILKPDKAMSEVFRTRFSSDESFYTGHINGNIYQWNLKNKTHRLIATGSKIPFTILVPKNAPNLMICLSLEGGDVQNMKSELKVIDVRTGKSYPIKTHGNRVSAVAVDPSGTVLVTGGFDGIVRVGPITGYEPHLLFGHQNWVVSVAVDSDLHWIASSERDRPVVRLWRMPTGKPLQTLTHDELLKKLSSLTNVRVVDDEKDPSGYRIQFDPFPGWKTLPTW